MTQWPGLAEIPYIVARVPGLGGLGSKSSIIAFAPTVRYRSEL